MNEKSQKPVIVFVFEKKMGGVAYMNIEIINNSAIRDYFNVRVVLVRPDDLNIAEELFDKNINADELIVFNFNPLANRYYQLKFLRKIIGDEDGLVICNNFLELDCIALFPAKKIIYQFIHDFYSVKLFINRGMYVDAFLTHSGFWKDVLYSSGPEWKPCTSILHGVELVDYTQKKNPGEKLKIAFAGRWVKEKGVLLLKDIDEELKRRNVEVNWVIIGKGNLGSQLRDQWKNKNNAEFISPVRHGEVLDKMLQCDLFVLPSEFEGYGIAIVEALSCGLVPIVNDLPGGTAEILSEVGFKISGNDINLYTSVIENLHNDREKIKRMQSECRTLAEKKYDIRQTANNYLQEFRLYNTVSKRKRPSDEIRYGSLLDKPFFPEKMVTVIRRFI